MGSGGQGPDNPNTLGIKLIHGLKNGWIVKPLTKTRNDNPTRIIASCGRTAVENLLIFVEKCLPRSSENRHKNVRHTAYVRHNWWL